MGNPLETPIPLPPDFPPTSYADDTPPPPVISVDATELARPTQGFNFPQSTMDQIYRWSYWFSKDHLATSAHAHQNAGRTVEHMITMSWVWHAFVDSVAGVIVAIIAPIFDALSSVRIALEAKVGPLVVTSINELFGGGVDVSHIQTGTDPGSMRARAIALGGVFHDQFLSKFAGEGIIDPKKGFDAARQFTGQIAEFGATTGLLDILGGMVPEIHLNVLGEIGAQVGGGFGLGRLHRVVMRPLLTTLMAVPYQHYLNQLLRPTPYSRGDLFNPYTGASLPDADLYSAGALLGFTKDKIDALIRMHRKKITPADVQTLSRWQLLPSDQIAQISKDAGIDDNYSSLLTILDGISRADSRVQLFVTALETAFVDGEIDQTEFESSLNSLPIHPNERDIVKKTAAFRLAIHTKHKRVSEAHIEYAFEHGLVDLAELESFYAAAGYDDESVTILTQIVLYRTKVLADTAAAKAARLAAKAVVTAAKAAAGAILPPAPVSTPPTP